ncbi:sulfatase-like hydrolase/transferase, partial [Clostridium frigidicarnis]
FQSVNYVDKQIGNLVNMLKEKNQLDNTVLVIYGDHTGVHKFYQDKVNEIKNMEEKFREKDLRVPFIIYNPELSGEKKDVIGGQIDMMPTVAYLMGIERDRLKDSAMGRILVNTERNSTILNNGEIMGKTKSKEEENHIKNVFSVADKIIEGNYFKNKQ